MTTSPWFERLAKDCRRLGCQVVIRQAGETVSILIRHREHGPIVSWSTFNGSVEETARYALLSTERL